MCVRVHVLLRKMNARTKSENNEITELLQTQPSARTHAVQESISLSLSIPFNSVQCLFSFSSFVSLLFILLLVSLFPLMFDDASHKFIFGFPKKKKI